MAEHNNDPTGNAYGFHTTAEEIAQTFDLTGKYVIITGGYSGIGRETARVLAKRGAHVYLAGRDEGRCHQAVDELKTETNNPNITPIALDLASLDSVRKAAETFNKQNVPLHYLILNAAVMACPYSKTKDGFEMQFGTNFIGHFLFANLLVPRLIQGAPSRVVSVASSAHFMGKVQFEDINFEKGRPYAPWEAYGQSKTANILFANEFNRRYKSRGVVANSLHPGSILTELQRHVQTAPGAGVGNQTEVTQIPGYQEAAAMGREKKTIPQGASTTLFAALDERTSDGGKFYHNCAEYEPAKWANDPEVAKKLWDMAEEWTGLSSTTTIGD